MSCRPPIAVVSVSLLTALVTGCPRSHSEAVADAAPAVAEKPAASSACSADVGPFVIDKGARGDTGITLVKLADGRIAIGYATGAGAPKAAVVDTDGTASIVDVDTSHLDDEKKKDPQSTVRTINRVTPLGFKDQVMRIGVDLLDVTPAAQERMRTRYLRCGPADQEPIIADDGLSFYDSEFNPPPVDPTSGDGNAQEPRDCRTFTSGDRTWVLASKMEFEAETGDYAAAWVIDEKPGKASIQEPFIDFKTIPAPKDKSAPKPILYEVPVSMHIPGAGFIMASRLQGQLVVVKRTSKLEKQGDAIKFNMGAPVGLPGFAITGHEIALFVTEQGQKDLYGSVFTAESKPVKPEKLTLDDPNPPTEGDRSSATVATTAKGDLIVGFNDGKAGNKHARITVLDPKLKSKMPVYDVTPADGNVAEVRVASMKDGRILATYLETKDGSSVISGVVVSCKY